jgi:hypothetical protein
MNTWLFFGLLVVFLAIVEFVPIETVDEAAGSGSRFSPSQLRLIHVAWYGLFVAASAGYWLGFEVARFVLGGLFGVAAVFALICLLSWLGSRFR